MFATPCRLLTVISLTSSMRHPISPKISLQMLGCQWCYFCLNKKMSKSGRACAGKGFMPFQKQCSTYFSLRTSPVKVGSNG